MTYQSHTPEKDSQVLLGIREGMLVYDWDDKRIGNVKYVQFPNESANFELAERKIHFTGLDKMPEDIQARLLQEGFVQVDGGLFAPDRYVLPGQILDVNDKDIVLNVLKTELIQF